MSDKVILHPCHPDYCKGCKYDGKYGNCTNEEYGRNAYHVLCELRYCPYRDVKELEGDKE